MGFWQGKKVLFIGDSITARRVYPEVIKEILGIETYYHCRGGRGIMAMVDGDRGLNGDYSDFSPTADLLLPLSAEEVTDKDLIVLYGGYNNLGRACGKAGDLYALDGSGQKTIVGYMQYAINRIYEELEKADNLGCRILVVTVDCPGKSAWTNIDGYTECNPGAGDSFEGMAMAQCRVAEYNSLPVCDLFHTSGINRRTWKQFAFESTARNDIYSPYLLDENGVPVDNNEIRYEKGKSYYQIRDGKVVLEEYNEIAPYPYNRDQLHKSPAGYRRIGEVIAGAIIKAYGN